MRLFMLFFYVLLVLFGVSFAALNAESVKISFYVIQLTLPIALLVALMLSIGILLGVLIFLYPYWRLRVRYLKVKNQLKITEKEIKNLRCIPLQDEH